MVQFTVDAGSTQAVEEVGSELGVNLVNEGGTEGYAESLRQAFQLVSADPFLQGIFFGALITKNVSIRINSKDGLVITISNLKTLKKFIDRFK